jgi:two-component system, chemotaxis family, chemotaxis protein CheY
MREILVAEDDAGLRESLRLALEAAGYRVRVAAHGGEAFALQTDKPAEILITDIFMPQCDGFEAIDRFRSAFPATKIVAMSGDAKRAMREYLPVAALIGVDATLKKPFRLQDLLETLKTLHARA